jgi:hypothetical protein
MTEAEARLRDMRRWITVPVRLEPAGHPDYVGTKMLANTFGGKSMRVNMATRVEDIKPVEFQESVRKSCDTEWLWQIHPADAVAAGYAPGRVWWTCVHSIEAD